MSAPRAGRRTPTPRPPAGLPDDHATELAEIVERALLDQRRNIADGLEGALARVPRILRGPVRKVAGG